MLTYLRPRSIAMGACLVASVLAAGCDNGATADPLGASALDSRGCVRRNNLLERLLLECVTIAGVNEHLEAFQGFADANGGTRRDGTPGFDASADYVATRLGAAGWTVTRTALSYERLDGTLRQLVPINAPYETGVFSGTGFGAVTASVTPVDINLTLPRDNTSGCEAADFIGFPAGNIALVQRGVCTFADKVLNAQAAGASAVIIFNQGNTPDREGLIVGTLGGVVATVPVVGASFADGAVLATAGSVAQVTAAEVTVASENILAERPGRSGRVVMAGAHLDSWPESPGINSNGSGAAVLLEVAENLASTRLPHTLRFAWWGAHTAGVLGSETYVDGLSSVEVDAIALYLNFDVIGSPNYVRFVLDSDGPGGLPEAAPVEAFLTGFYTSRGLASEPSPLGTTFSDWAPFGTAGIPFGGLFTGATGIKTAEEAAIYGGTAGAAYDPCFTEACDTLDNISLTVLDLNADVAAAAILHFRSTSTLPARGGSTNAARSGPALAMASE